MSKLKNKISIITGAANGIGKATAQLFAQEGATVYVWDVDKSGQKVVDDIVSKGGRAQYQQVAVNDRDNVKKAIAEILNKHNKIDILINNAGITRDRSLLKMEDKEWSDVLDVNLTGVFNCVKEVAPSMKENNYGRIISAASNVALKGNYGQTNYAAAKAGIIGMTKVWTLELAKYGITVNAVAPGYIETAMTQGIPEEVKKTLIAHIPAGRTGRPEEIAKAYLFLASDDAAYINGTCLCIDGGVTR